MPRKTRKDKVIADLRRQLKFAKSKKEREISTVQAGKTKKPKKSSAKQTKTIDFQFDFSYLKKDLLKIGLLSLSVILAEALLFLKLERNYF